MPPSDWPCWTMMRRASALGIAPGGGPSAKPGGPAPLITTGAGFDCPPPQEATSPANAIAAAERTIPCRPNFHSAMPPPCRPPDVPETIQPQLRMKSTDTLASLPLCLVILAREAVNPTARPPDQRNASFETRPLGAP